MILRTLFLILSGLGLLTALGTVLARNLVHAALFLIAFFFLVACQFALLEAEFLAAMQVLVYVGAVAILLLFGIMLTRDIRGDESSRPGGRSSLIPAALAGLGVFAVLALGIHASGRPAGQPNWAISGPRTPVAELPKERREAIEKPGRAFGVELMTRYAVPFELAGVMLTAALVGAVALARREAGDEADPPVVESERR